MNFKKNFTRIVVLFVVLILSIALFAACDDKKNPSGNDTTYSVTVQEGDGFEVSGISADGYHKDAEVDFTVTVTDSTKELKSVQVDGSTLLANANGHYGFRMPDHDVTISVVLESVPPTLELDKTEVSLNIHSNASTVVTATLTPQTEGLNVVWTTSNFNVATVSGNGASATITAQSKGQATITASVAWQNETISAAVTVTVDDAITWSPEEEAIMKEHLHGLVLFPTNDEFMEAQWIAQENMIVVDGGYVEDTGLAEYAAKYTVEDGWINITDQYGVPQGYVYIFEKAVQTTEGTRYIDVFIYATDYLGEFASEGNFIIQGFDPYVYEWPVSFLTSLKEDIFLTEEDIPSVDAPYYYLSSNTDANYYSIAAYYESSEKDGGYGDLLREQGWTVTEVDDYYTSLSPDNMFTLSFSYSNGRLSITFSSPIVNDWDAVKTIITAYMGHYVEQGAEVFEIPALEGASSYIFVDGKYNQIYIRDYGESRYSNLYGAVGADGVTNIVYSDYIKKLFDTGWKEIGANTSSEEQTNLFIKTVPNDDKKVYVIGVYFIPDANSSSQKGTVEIDIYYIKRDDPTKGWQTQAVTNWLGKYVTDTIPAYDGEIVSFMIEGEYIYVRVPAEDHASAEENYIKTLTNAGYTVTGNPNQSWSIRYISPNKQLKLTLSHTSGVNTLTIRVEYMPSEWNETRIAESLHAIGSSVTVLPKFTTATKNAFVYSVQVNTFTLTIDSLDFTKEEWTAYAESLKTASGWTVDSEKTTDRKVVLVADDGTTLTAALNTYGDLIIRVTVPAE